MKKLYFLDEEEKNRILNLHESATKRHYLGEQETKTSGNAVDDLNTVINNAKNPGSQPEVFGGYNNQNIAQKAAVQKAADMLSNFNGFGGDTTKSPEVKTAPAVTTGTEVATPSTTVAPVNEPLKWSPDPTGNKTWEYQFKDNSWFARKKGTTKEYNISKDEKYANSVNKLNTSYPEAIKPVSTTTPTNTTPVTPVNTVVGDANLEAVKKTAEAGVAVNTTNKQEQPIENGTKFAEVDSSEFT